jgi:uncharacterized protein YbaP (TraB family)
MMKWRWCAWSTVVLGLLLISGASAGTDERSFLWRATNGERTVSLLGSIHYMKTDAYPLSPAIEAAYDRSGLIVFETDIEGLGRAAVALLEAGTIEGEGTLDSMIPADLYQQVSERFDALGMGVAGFAKMKPWMVALSLTSLELMRAGYLGTEGVDAHFSSRAATDGKRRMALESIEHQISLFADLGTDESTDFLRYSLTELDTVIPLVDELVASWKRGDSARMEELLLDGFEDHPELFDRLVTQRNREWMPQIEALFDGDVDAMVVVGSLHLVGEHGLVGALRAKGYKVEQL